MPCAAHQRGERARTPRADSRRRARRRRPPPVRRAANALDAHRLDRIGVAHQHDRRAIVLAAELAPRSRARRARPTPCLQRALARALDHRAVGHRIGERHAELDHVGARLDQRVHQRHGGRARSGSPAVMNGMSALRLRLRERARRCCDADMDPRRTCSGGSTVLEPEAASATVCMSLSPRPRGSPAATASFGSVGASFAA